MNSNDLKAYINDSVVSPSVALEYIQTCININTGCSLIRLSDGEAKLLSYPEYTSRKDIDNQLKIWFGDKEFSESEIKNLKLILISSIKNADILGVPGADRTFASNSDGFSKDAINCQNLWSALLDYLGQIALKEKIMVNANIHHYMQLNKYYRDLILKFDKVGFVANRIDLISEYQQFSNVVKSTLIVIPAETWNRAESTSTHYPQRFKDINSMISLHDFKNEIWWIGAGPLGKYYTVNLAMKGAIAIDIGAVMDGWNNCIPDERKGLADKKNKMTIKYLFESEE